jgi:hypothetical protein
MQTLSAKRIGSVSGLDIRSVAFFRILLGLFLLAELLSRILANFHDIYSPETGVLGNCFASGYASAYSVPPLIFDIDTDGQMLVFMALYGSVLLTFTLGILPRISAFFAVFMLWLLNTRYNVLYLGWEMYASVLLFWSVLLPIGSSYSILVARREKADALLEWRSPLAFAMMFQIAFIYFYNGISKNGDKWMSGHAVKFFLAEYDKMRPMAWHLIEMDGLLTLLTYATLAFEVLLPLIIFFPLWNDRFRLIAALSILLFHWSIDLVIDVGNFKYVGTSAAMLLLPGTFWDALRLKALEPWRTLQVAPFEVNALTKLATWFLAFALVSIIVVSNLNHTLNTRTNDRVKQFLKWSNANRVIERAQASAWPQYSFFSQYWHLYSPDPPTQKGYLQVEAIKRNGDTLSVFSGRSVDSGLYVSAVQQNLFQYLLLKGGRNKKEHILEQCLLMREIQLWNKHSKDEPLAKMELVVYDHRPQTAKEISAKKPEFTRIAVKTFEVSYKK